MELILIFTAVFIVLILSCWLIFRRSRRYSFRNDALVRQVNPDLMYPNAKTDQPRSSDGIELGPVKDADADESAYFSDWQDDDVDDESVDPIQQSMEEEGEDEFSEESWEEHIESSQSIEPAITPEADWNWSESDGLNGEADSSVEKFETEQAHEPNTGVQTNLPLHTILTDSNHFETDWTSIEPIDVDETIEFPRINNSDNQNIEMLGWIPGNGSTVARTEILALVRDFGENFELPVSLYGQLENSDSWINLKDEVVSARFLDLMFTIQLTHHGKSIDAEHWWRFYNMGEQIAQALSRPFYPSLSLDSAQAMSLRLAEQVDNLNIQATLILQSKTNKRLSSRTLDYVAREYDLVQRGNEEVFEKMDKMPLSFAPVYTLTTNLPPRPDGTESDQEAGLALTCNLPCVRDPLEAFDQMVDLARKLESRFPLELVDEERLKVSTKEIQMIRLHLRNFADDMQFCGITPGSETAMRLFYQPTVEETDSETSEPAGFAAVR